jgi:acylphosphatase
VRPRALATRPPPQTVRIRNTTGGASHGAPMPSAAAITAATSSSITIVDEALVMAPKFYPLPAIGTLPVVMADRERRRVVVYGEVQGVFFRDSARREAERRGVAGWVTNRPDGAVEAVFEGDPEAVAALVAFMREGPSRAEVERVDETGEEPEGLDGFRVR